MATLVNITPPAATREEFLAERRSGIGGSDVHHLFNLEPYGCRRRLWYEKRGIEPDDPQEETGAMRRGVKLEDLVAEEYCEQTGHSVQKVGLARHPEFPFELVHVDRLIYSPDRTVVGVLECKTVNREMYYKALREGLPAGYILQVQHGIHVTSAAVGARITWGAFAILWADQWKFMQWPVERDDEQIELIHEECQSAWREIENGPAPERLDIWDERCSRCPWQMTCQGEAMAELVTAKAGKGEEYDMSLTGLHQEHQILDEKIRALEEQLDGVKEEIRTRMGNRLVVVTGTGKKIHYKPFREWDVPALDRDHGKELSKFRTKVDLTAFGAAHPELEKDYKKPGANRRLRVY